MNHTDTIPGANDGISWLNMAAVALVIAALVLFPFVVKNRFYISLLNEMLIYGLLAMSLDVLLGYTGLLSFMHNAYLGISAYVVGLFLIHIYAQPRCFMDKHIPVFDGGRTRKNLPGEFIELLALLYAEIPYCQVNMRVGCMPHGGGIAGTVPGGSDIEPFTEPGHFHGRGDPSYLGYVDPDKIIHSPAHGFYPFMRIV